MLSYFFTVGEQVLILFILIAIGFICGKVNFMSDKTAKHMTDIVLYFVTPCVIISAYQIDFDSSILLNLGIVALCAVGIYIISAIIVTLVFREKDTAKRTVLKFATVFSNCGFMSLPLQKALLGTDGILYGAAFIAVFNIALWSYGVVCMSGSIKSISIKKLLLNPGIIGVALALIFFLTSFKLPPVIITPIDFLAALNTPIPMIIIGFYLSKNNIINGLKSKSMWLSVLIRLIVIPLASLGLMYAIGIRGSILVSCVIATSAPVAAATTMFATKFNRCTSLSVNLVSVSTILSIFTMSVIVSLAQMTA